MARVYDCGASGRVTVRSRAAERPVAGPRRKILRHQQPGDVFVATCSCCRRPPCAISSVEMDMAPSLQSAAGPGIQSIPKFAQRTGRAEAMIVKMSLVVKGVVAHRRLGGFRAAVSGDSDRLRIGCSKVRPQGTGHHHPEYILYDQHHQCRCSAQSLR